MEILESRSAACGTDNGRVLIGKPLKIDSLLMGFNILFLAVITDFI